MLKTTMRALAFAMALALLAACGAALGEGATDMNNTPFGRHGSLRVDGVRLVDAAGQPFALRGVSTHGIAWFPQYVNADTFAALRDDWGANVVRLAMYTAEYAGYLTDGDRGQTERLIDDGVRFATELGMYVVIDWHILSDGDPLAHVDEAVDFFRRMAAKYASYGNVLYEICNEPNGDGVDWPRVKRYAETVIPAIRESAPDALILCGTPTWSQDVDAVAADPLDDGNLMYTLHFYAATHKDGLRAKLEAALAAGTPVFISEFSICDASGNGAVDYESAEAWRALIVKHGFSYIGWNLSNKDESSAFFRPDCDDLSGWRDDQLNETAAWLRRCLREDREG